MRYSHRKQQAAHNRFQHRREAMKKWIIDIQDIQHQYRQNGMDERIIPHELDRIAEYLHGLATIMRS